MPYPGRNQIYDATIRRMVTEAMQAQEDEFRAAHLADEDETLLRYLRDCASRLEHTPWPREIPGGAFLVERFGTWEAARERAGLPPQRTPDKITLFSRYREETCRQQEIYRQRKAEKKARACLID